MKLTNKYLHFTIEMASVANTNGFNNLLFNTKKVAIAEKMEHLAGHIGLDLKPKKPSRIDEILTAKASQINGKQGDLKYKPTEIRNRPLTGYDARYDPTLLNSVRNKYVDVSGLLIPNRDLPKKTNLNTTTHPLTAYGIIR